MKTFKSHDGTTWKVDVRMPGASNAMIVFRHPDGSSSRKDRYNWILNAGPEARSVTGRMSPAKALDALDDEQVAELFRRSMAVTRADQHHVPRAEAVMSRG
jgi:hypothetical protein